MTHIIPTAPFGSRRLNDAHIRDAQQILKPGQACHHASVSKWHVFQTIREAREYLALSDRALTILHALLSFHQKDNLHQNENTIVWPSNNALMERSNGIPLSTLRRHIAILVQKGIIIRRDSPNGKRYARHSQNGDTDTAYGFDLNPLIVRADEFKKIAIEVKTEKLKARQSRNNITILRRSISKTIEYGKGISAPTAFDAFEATYRKIISELKPKLSFPDLDAIEKLLEALYTNLIKSLEINNNNSFLSINAHQNETHIEDSKPESRYESKKDISVNSENSNELNVDRHTPHQLHPQALANASDCINVDLSTLLLACPSISELDNCIRSWNDIDSVMITVKKMLKIPFWLEDKAISAFGRPNSNAIIATIYQRSEIIASPSAYLQSLIKKSSDKSFEIHTLLKNMIKMQLATKAKESHIKMGNSSLKLSRNAIESLHLNEIKLGFASCRPQQTEISPVLSFATHEHSAGHQQAATRPRYATPR